jgi:hypothetical protein
MQREAVLELLTVERLAEVVVHSGRLAFQVVVLHRVRSQSHDGNALRGPALQSEELRTDSSGVSQGCLSK